MKRKGIGYSCMFYGTGYGNGFPDESRSVAELKPDGTITIYVEATDVGQGAKNVMRQIAAETLNLNIEYITICNSNTSLMLDSGTAAASRQTYNTGNAVFNSCKKLRDNIFKAIGEEDKQNMQLYKELLMKAYSKSIENKIDIKAEGYFKADASPVDLETGQGNPYWPYTFATQKAVVEVDDETGKIDVIEIETYNDSGKIINPEMAEGQIQGGVAMGIGYAIMEEIEFQNGVIKNSNFSDYIIPTSLDVPNVKINFVEDKEESGPYGAKGLGEPSMVPTVPAVINAIYDAVGVRMTELPATCDRVLQAIKNKEGCCSKL